MATSSSANESPVAPSPSHNIVAVPTDFFQCSMPNLVGLVSSMLQQLVDINDRFELNPEKLTRFHSRTPPAISIRDYLVRIVRFCSVEKSILITLIYFIDLLAKSYQSFSVTTLTVHRFLITAVTVASKGLCDTFCTNTHYARVGGLSPMELNLLEVEFLTRVDYNIVPTHQLLTDYYTSMVSRENSIYVFDPTIPSTLSSTKTHIEEAEDIPIALTKIVATPPSNVSSPGGPSQQSDSLGRHVGPVANSGSKTAAATAAVLDSTRTSSKQQGLNSTDASATTTTSNATPNSKDPTYSLTTEAKKPKSSFKKSLSKLMRPTKRTSDQNPPGREAVEQEDIARNSNLKKQQTTPKRPRPLY